MIAEVVALLLFIGPDIKEHRIQENMAACLRGKRIAMREYKPNIEFKCIISKGQLDKNIDGSTSIKSLILE